MDFDQGSEKSSGEVDLNCRFYENQYPEVGELVMVKIMSAEEMGAYVTLLEYNNIEGMIPMSELSNRRVRSYVKLIRVGRIEVATVLRVDTDKGYIDLSKKRVSAEEISQCEDRFNKAKTVHSILRHVASLAGMDLEKLYMLVGWPLYKKFGHAYEAFKLAKAGEDIFEGLEVPEELTKLLLDNIQKKLKTQPFKLRADLEVTCFKYDGIDAIKAALRKGEQSNPDMQIKIKIVAPPLYVMNATSLDKNKGVEALESAIQIIKAAIEEKNGEIRVKNKPRVVSGTDDWEKAYADYMENEANNAEPSNQLGSDESSEGEQEGSSGSEQD